MLERMKGLLRDEEGQGATEYGLMVALVVVVVVAAMAIFGGQLNTIFTTIGSKISEAVD
jgi:pilus assembly protein Flp/PilA